MKKHTAIHLLGGSVAAAARAVGLTKQAVSMWPTDEFGNLTSRASTDAVLAALVRMNYRERRLKPEDERIELDEATLDDLFSDVALEE